jgi:hypothetical protein
MNGVIARSPACWPTATQELLLLACFAPDDRAITALNACRSQLSSDSLDPVSDRLLSLLFHRWRERLPDGLLLERAQRSHSAIRLRNQRRFLRALAISRDLDRAGIPCLFLKGLALTVSHYRDPALRFMEDVDLLVQPGDVEAAAQTLQRAGWIPEEGAGIAEIMRGKRVRHAWQFNAANGESCDLHWHPVLRCYSPAVAALFWQGARGAKLLDRQVNVPCPTDQLFHVCAHGLQWSWTPQIRWVPDALAVLGSSIGPSPELDWNRLVTLAAHAEMNVRLSHALSYLRETFEAQIPLAVLDRLQSTNHIRREEREYLLLQKECPLGLTDRALWHVTNFRRIRRFDPEWASRLWGPAFAEYISTFLNSSGIRDTARALKARTEEPRRPG